jgi:hypothetical protein
MCRVTLRARTLWPAALIVSALAVTGIPASSPTAGVARAAGAPRLELTVAPGRSEPGGRITISARGFVPHETLIVSLTGWSRPIATLHADAQGTLPPTRITLPATSPAGRHTLTVTGARSHRHVSRGLAIAAATPLPHEALAIVLAVVIALVILLLGGGFVALLVRRRRRGWSV